jgi:hypothetical protein
LSNKEFAMNQVSLTQLLERITQRRGLIFGGILMAALLAFEVFNYSTTDFALTDVLGGSLKFIGIRWATILAIAFCGIDFAGLARLFTPEQGSDEPAEVWYLFGAWLLAAAMNAVLTWWGVAVAVNSHSALGSAIIAKGTLNTVVPVFVAVMVWVIRILIIGTFSIAGERLFSMAEDEIGAFRRKPVARPVVSTPVRQQPAASIATTRSVIRPETNISAPIRPAPKPEPSYHPVGMAAKSANDELATRR